ncbi:MAG: hypothetical protein NC222_06290 [Staphylococcus sp.]|nr:hypothetical protein [Staphylococcus sp.]
MYIFDLDGTLADISHRLHFVFDKNGTKKEKPVWKSFFKECVNDKPIEKVCKLAHTLSQYNKVIILTGRSSEVAKETSEWINKNVFHFENLFNYFLIMRKEGDHRPDKIVKPELLNKFLEGTIWNKDDIQIIFEDRQGMVDTWRKLGYTCFQVSEGNY